MGKVLFQTQTDPTTPSSGKAAIFVDSADKHLKMIDELGALTDFHASVIAAIVAITSVDSPYTNLDSTDILFVDATSGNITVGLNSVLTAVRPVKIIRIDNTANVVTLDPSGAQSIINDLGAAVSTILLGARQGVNLLPLASSTTWYRG